MLNTDQPLTPVLLPVIIVTFPVKSGIFSNEKFLFAMNAILLSGYKIMKVMDNEKKTKVGF
jgi:hypothetical protein